MKNLWRNTQWIQSQPFWFTLLRIGIGWHFLWEGWIKLADPNWSAQGYLSASWGPISPILRWIAENEMQWPLTAVNILVPWCLFIAGFFLILGMFSRSSILAAMLLLAFFIFAAPANPYMTLNPPGAELQWSNIYVDLDHAQWTGKHMIGSEGSYFLVNKNVIELIALACLLTFNPRKLYGIDHALSSVRILCTQKNAEMLKTAEFLENGGYDHGAHS
ncbi:MAG: DoxX family protein [Candidatus Omnitrophica bacterium]|nr:DoxX family protein [Candidatus Omnitrophota bacterium]